MSGARVCERRECGAQPVGLSLRTHFGTLSMLKAPISLLGRGAADSRQTLMERIPDLALSE
ncbi:MAG TPA: hypothetical protein VFQ35_12920, partial [Polyangiaceae bacterium]|nr:hypothetical protein [Polyangiaceae bacterium]